jgi:hypothetical protein
VNNNGRLERAKYNPRRFALVDGLKAIARGLDNHRRDQEQANVSYCDCLLFYHMLPKGRNLLQGDFARCKTLRLDRLQNSRGGNAQKLQTLSMILLDPIAGNHNQVHIAPSRLSVSK